MNYRRSALVLKMQRIIFEADTKAGKLFDIILILAIILSVIAVMLESVGFIKAQFREVFLYTEWFFTILFSLEYICRVISAPYRRRYIFSFFGLIDIISILPTFLSLFFTGAQSLLVIRSFRLLRIFRVFKLTKYLKQAHVLLQALNDSRPKITVFLVGILAAVTTMGALMYLIEGEEHGFTSIPKSVYWEIVTMTTVGYGDISPQTPLGQMFASILMILGYGVLAVPTGIVTHELSKAEAKTSASSKVCPDCGEKNHLAHARFCHQCSADL